MSLEGSVATGAFNVKFDGKEAARKSDLTDHGGMIVDGVPTVVIGGTALCASTVGHRFTCPDVDVLVEAIVHKGGVIVAGSSTVFVAGLPAARKGDATLCLGPDSTVGDGDGKGDGAPQDNDCAALWKKYQKQAQDMLDKGSNYVEKNAIISGAYANLYLQDNSLAWAGLAAYASKQVGCAMNQALTQVKDPSIPGAEIPALYTYNKLGEGNCNLFLDIYPTMLFYMHEGYAKMAKCAAERHPPLPAQLLDGFKALDLYKQTGDRSYLAQHVASLAYHEQINILQRDIYNDPAMQGILRTNQQGWIPGTSPAGVNLGAGCTAQPGDYASKFDNGKRDSIYSVPQRMDWILNDIGNHYMNGVQGTPKMNSDMQTIQNRGQLAGGSYS